MRIFSTPAEKLQPVPMADVSDIEILATPELKAPPVEKKKAAPAPPHKKWKIKLGWEDLILGLALLVIVVSWIKGAFTPEQVLAYLGFTTTGGVWGYVSGLSKK